MNGHRLASESLGNFVIDFIGQARKSKIVLGQVPKILDLEMKCESGLMIGSTAKGFVISVVNSEAANDLLKTLSTSNRYEGSIVFDKKDRVCELGAFTIFPEGSKPSRRYLLISGRSYDINGESLFQRRCSNPGGEYWKLLPATQSIEWSHSFDGCKTTHNVRHR